ncbi:MAG: hypothetical protein V3V05_03805 [Pontiella sp.]
MAYFSIQGTASGRLDLLNQIKDFLVTTVGWTLHDDQSADARPYYVFKSVGESGAEDIYLRFQIGTSSGRIEVAAFQYWDNTAQTGVNSAFYSSYTYIRAADTADFIYWIYADLDHVFVVSKIVSTYYGHYSGSIKRFWSSAIAITQSAIVSGSAVVAQVNDASIFSPDQHYLIKDDANIERIKISAIDTVSTPNTVTIEMLSNDYSAGAKIGEDPQPVITGYYNMPATFYAVNKFDGWSSVTGQRGRCGAAHGNLQGDTDPEQRYGTTILFPWMVSMNGSSSYQELRGELIEIYSTGGGNVASEDTIEIDADSYRVFYLSGGGWCAIKE